MKSQAWRGQPLTVSYDQAIEQATTGLYNLAKSQPQQLHTVPFRFDNDRFLANVDPHGAFTQPLTAYCTNSMDEFSPTDLFGPGKFLYHGTEMNRAVDILCNGISLHSSNVKSDFGAAHYMFDQPQPAMDWAKEAECDKPCVLVYK
jgi:hypothetical protein